MNDHTGRLVDDEQVLVLPGDLEAGRLGLHGRHRGRIGQLHADLLSGKQPVALRTRQTVDEHNAVRDQPLGGGARADVGLLREVAVESLPCGFDGYVERDQERNVDAPWRRRGLRSPASIVPRSSATPTTMHTSARLNAGQ
jgi:hypothetical protein